MEFNEIATSDPNLKIHMNIFFYDGILEGELTISDEIESFMWFGANDDKNLLSNIKDFVQKEIDYFNHDIEYQYDWKVLSKMIEDTEL